MNDMKKEYVKAEIYLVKITESDILSTSDVLIDGKDLFGGESDNQ